MSEFFQENFDEKEGRGKLNENWKLFANRLFVPKIEKDRGGRGGIGIPPTDRARQTMDV